MIEGKPANETQKVIVAFTYSEDEFASKDRVTDVLRAHYLGNTGANHVDVPIVETFPYLAILFFFLFTFYVAKIF